MTEDVEGAICARGRPCDVRFSRFSRDRPKSFTVRTGLQRAFQPRAAAHGAGLASASAASRRHGRQAWA